MAKRKRTPRAYRVESDTSVRRSADPDSPEWDEWLHYAAGDVVTNPPEHADVDGWLASGHWIPIEDEEG